MAIDEINNNGGGNPPVVRNWEDIPGPNYCRSLFGDDGVSHGISDQPMDTCYPDVVEDKYNLNDGSVGNTELNDKVILILMSASW